MKKKIGVLLCWVMIVILLVGCGEKSASLVGTWETDEKEEVDFGYFELYSDGTGLEKEELGTFSIKWTDENGKLKITLDTGFLGTLAFSYSYELTEDTLILTNDEGESATYTRVKESE